MTTDQPLDRIQRWMQTVITHPSGIAAGVDSDAARGELDVAASDVERVITRSQALDSIQRLQVYGNAYYARLLECLAVDYPTLKHALGEDAFGGFCFGYLQQYPSTSYTLNQLGARFPQYLEETRPARQSDGEQPEWPDFLIDLARLERLYSEVFDGPGEENLTLLKTADLVEIPQERWPDVRLVTVDSLRLVALRFPVHEYVTAVKKKESPRPPQPRQTWLAVNRRDYIVRRRTLSRTQYELLSALQAGRPLGTAIEHAVAESEFPTDELAGRLREWFQVWTAAGYFRRVE